MKPMKPKDYHEMLHFAPQRSTESRFACDYRANAHAQPVAKKARLMRVASDLSEMAAMTACFLLVVFVWGALS